MRVTRKVEPMWGETYRISEEEAGLADSTVTDQEQLEEIVATG